jgi:hypothetical protein
VVVLGRNCTLAEQVLHTEHCHQPLHIFITIKLTLFIVEEIVEDFQKRS